MTLSNSFDDQLVAAAGNLIDDTITNCKVPYCTHFWPGYNIEKENSNGIHLDNIVVHYCYMCKGKIRNYEIKSKRERFCPKDHSTPEGKFVIKNSNETPRNEFIDVTTNTVDNVNQCIPTISRHIDSSFRQKYTSYEMHINDVNERSLRKSLKGIGCIINLALTDSPVKKRTQIQACSISVMIIAIVVISFILVNFTTPSFTRKTNAISTTIVPTERVHFNETSIVTDNTQTVTIESDITEKPVGIESETENNTLLSSVILKIRKNIRTYPKKNQSSQKPKDIINRDLSPKFCECQTDEVCMLEEMSGTAVCRKAMDVEDPTGCGGLCALETEACQLVDRIRGVRVCRLLALVTCSPHEWRCRNGLCVPAEARCDGAIDCYDRSDEMYCDCDFTKQFRCGHAISCFSNTKLCDGIIDCWDGFDEVNCTKECTEHQFTCTDGQCIVPSRFCDGLSDCEDGSDEPQGCGVCAAHEIRCLNQRCVPRAEQCDGHDNCGDASDEIHCS